MEGGQAMTSIRWEDFCDKESSRYWIGEPRVIGGWKLATTAVMCIGIPTDEADTLAGEKKFPDVMAFLAPVIEQIGDTTPWPTVEPCVCFPHSENDNERMECPICKGTQKESCEECDGTGERECDMGHDHECDGCGGEGDWPCENCEYGTVSRIEYQEERCYCKVIVGGRSVASKLFDRIARLQDVQYFIPNSKGHEYQVWFRFGGGGFGVVMSLENQITGSSGRPIREVVTK